MHNDNEIIKALECCSHATYNSDCEKCPYYPDKECVKKQCTDIIDLINRQQAEIERLKAENLELLDMCAKQGEEAIKEFAERLKKEVAHIPAWGRVAEKKIDNLVKEMVGDE